MWSSMRPFFDCGYVSMLPYSFDWRRYWWLQDCVHYRAVVGEGHLSPVYQLRVDQVMAMLQNLNQHAHSDPQEQSTSQNGHTGYNRSKSIKLYSPQVRQVLERRSTQVLRIGWQIRVSCLSFMIRSFTPTSYSIIPIIEFLTAKPTFDSRFSFSDLPDQKMV